ncbi:MAG: hypothetical protein LBQ24_04435 [Candidatus Peribacteria bacterium]|jgi:hypothetical protein|nr:hypothetical protein [Candidatus Peribacteria bacterium]
MSSQTNRITKQKKGENGKITFNFINFVKNNIQFNQTLFLMTILVIGIQFYPVYFDYRKLLVVFSTTILSSYFFHYLKTGEHKFPYS